jgi:lysine 2,3-aminomutase
MDQSTRSRHLHETIDDYLHVLPQIRTGLTDRAAISQRQAQIRQQLGATEAQWDDYRWQPAHRITNVHDLEALLPLDLTTHEQIRQVGERYRFAISPYYLSLIDPEDPNCPIRRQAVPSVEELNPEGELDPMDEEHSSPVPAVTRRYPDRLIIKVTNQCGMYCRFCQRRRLIGETDHAVDDQTLRYAVQYIREQPEIRDVLITGGDALMLPDQTLARLLSELRAIPHVEIIRIGTRTPVALPQRITPELVAMLRQFHPLYVNTHFNSPAEITEEAKIACGRLADAGIPLGNQMVLLNGVNNNKYIVRRMNQLLLTLRVRPYYIFHPKTVRGTAHFWVRLEEGLEIMESLRVLPPDWRSRPILSMAPVAWGKPPCCPIICCTLARTRRFSATGRTKPFEVENHADRGLHDPGHFD